MAIYKTTLDQLVERVCKLFLRDWTEGTTTASGSTTTLKDTARQEADDYWNSKNAYVYIRSGSYAGHWAKVTDFAVSAGVGTITFAPAAGGAIASGVSYSLHTEFERDEVVEAINLAIDMVAEEALVWKIDETSVTLVADTYEYTLPTSFMYIHKITMADSDGNFYDNPIPPDQYKVIKSSTPKLHFLCMPPDEQHTDHYWGQLWANTDLTATRKLRIEGLGSPDVLSADTDACSISPAYLTLQAAAILHMGRSRGTESDPDDHYKQAKNCQDRADVERGRVVTLQLPADSKRCIE